MVAVYSKLNAIWILISIVIVIAIASIPEYFLSLSLSLSLFKGALCSLFFFLEKKFKLTIQIFTILTEARIQTLLRGTQGSQNTVQSEEGGRVRHM